MIHQKILFEPCGKWVVIKNSGARHETVGTSFGGVTLCVNLSFRVGAAVISNTKVCQSLLEVPPPPQILTTRIKAKLLHTQLMSIFRTKKELQNTRQGGGEAFPSQVTQVFPHHIPCSHTTKWDI